MPGRALITLNSPRAFRTHPRPRLYWIQFKHRQLVLEWHHRGPENGMVLDEVQKNDEFLTLVSGGKDHQRQALMRIQHRLLYERIQMPHGDHTWGLSLCPTFHLRHDRHSVSEVTQVSFGFRDFYPVLAITDTSHPSPKTSAGCGADIHVDEKRLEGSCDLLIVIEWLFLGLDEDPQDLDWQKHINHKIRPESTPPRLFAECRCNMPASDAEGHKQQFADFVKWYDRKIFDERWRLSPMHVNKVLHEIRLGP